jgi:hypothetical protein
MGNLKILLIVAYFTVIPGAIGYTCALAKEDGLGVTLFVCSLFIVFFLIGATIKYWFSHG